MVSNYLTTRGSSDDGRLRALRASPFQLRRAVTPPKPRSGLHRRCKGVDGEELAQKSAVP
jgi:hypothetical protein